MTVRGVPIAEVFDGLLAGATVSMFFPAPPPGVNGTGTAAYGTGSGSMTMAYQITRAIGQKAPMLIIDEDLAAANILLKSCLQGDAVTPLTATLAQDRECLGETALVFAACAMDTLIAQDAVKPPRIS